MLIKNILLDNFRSFTKKTFEFSRGTTVVVGPNTAGKSNLLEAIFLLAFGKSPRADLDREMVRVAPGEPRLGRADRVEPRLWRADRVEPRLGRGEEKLGFVRAVVSGSDPFDATQGRDLEVVLTETGKRFRVNGIGRRRADFSRHFHVVLFSPEDLNLVIGSPDLRRRFMVFALESVDPAYSHAVTQYDQVRKRRNRILEKINKGESSSDELGFWDEKLLEHGVLIQDKRKEFFAEINFSLSAGHLSLSYFPSGLTAERLMEYRPREIAAETSLIGPHRDDFSFLATSHLPLATSGRDLAAYGSRGEQRRAVLYLKKAELDFVEKRIESRPVLLLDDIFSELDEENRAQVFDLIAPRQARGDPERGRGVGEGLSASSGGPARNASASVAGGQTIITTTDLQHVPDNLRRNIQILTL